ncbi:uncharacterized protein Z518_05919 [Rhinocladiella mackenziei CBS 650.93]|uniref:UDP-N-acetylglucosamine transferase subunit ALG14 n=1 Tax=Rhinocladiella mackenziei CBS 650.93 TaxID=1442369 RepID=A0A0D2FSG2_9EURO|nr:uncharacterized protein Z518_05919 [Rhinocladiella mackenziei CBS 650.93]KIX05047.1 hypothetical protein Z518_05919 [Rhinocladiella mackenziei CBS 650.93]
MDAHGIQLSKPPGVKPEASFFNITNSLNLIASLSPTRELRLATVLILLNLVFFRLASVLTRKPIFPRPPASDKHPTHVLVVLGSGGHTAEMLNMLSQAPRFQLDFTYRTYLVSSGDSFSALKAHEFEKSMLSQLHNVASSVPEGTSSNYDVVTVHRARRVYQSILTAPISSLQCLWDCSAVLRGTHRDYKPLRNETGKAGFCERARGYPDLILTNGPGTGVIVILASIILLFFGFGGPSSSALSILSDRSHRLHPQSGQMRSIFIESWARVKTLSLSGRLLKPFVDRFLVQWPQLVEAEGKRVEYIGPLVT